MASADDLIKAKLKELIAKRNEVQAKLAPHRKAIDDAYAEIQNIKDSLAEHRAAILANTPELKDVEMEISKLATALGGKSMSDF